jgi:hypothetical protein
MIWKMTEPRHRVIRLHWSKTKGFCPINPIILRSQPIGLYVCTESRIEAKRSYKEVLGVRHRFAPTKRDSKIYVDPSQDGIWVIGSLDRTSWISAAQKDGLTTLFAELPSVERAFKAVVRHYPTAKRFRFALPSTLQVLNVYLPSGTLDWPRPLEFEEVRGPQAEHAVFSIRRKARVFSQIREDVEALYDAARRVWPGMPALTIRFVRGV